MKAWRNAAGVFCHTGRKHNNAQHIIQLETEADDGVERKEKSDIATHRVQVHVTQDTTPSTRPIFKAPFLHTVSEWNVPIYIGYLVYCCRYICYGICKMYRSYMCPAPSISASAVLLVVEKPIIFDSRSRVIGTIYIRSDISCHIKRNFISLYM